MNINTTNQCNNNVDNNVDNNTNNAVSSLSVEDFLEDISLQPKYIYYPSRPTIHQQIFSDRQFFREVLNLLDITCLMKFYVILLRECPREEKDWEIFIFVSNLYETLSFKSKDPFFKVLRETKLETIKNVLSKSNVPQNFQDYINLFRRARMRRAMASARSSATRRARG